MAIGGTGIVGAVGQVLAGLELAEGAASVGLEPGTVVVPSATGGTQAGLLVGLRTAGLATDVHGVAVTPPEPLRPVIAAIATQLGELDGLAAVDDREIVLDGAQLGDGYGRPTEAADDATRLLARTEGILVDPIYTAKALAGLVALARDGALTAGRSSSGTPAGRPACSNRSTCDR